MIGRILINPSIIKSFFTLIKLNNYLLKSISIHILTFILPYYEIELINQLAFDCQLITQNETIISYLIHDIGRIHNTWCNHNDNISTNDSTTDAKSDSTVETTNNQLYQENEYNIANKEIELIHILSKHKLWNNHIKLYIQNIISKIPEILNNIKNNTQKLFSEILLTINITNLHEIYGIIAIFGGFYETLAIGNEAIYHNPDGINEKCIILGYTVPPTIDPKQKDLVKLWENCNCYGDAIKINVIGNINSIIVPLIYVTTINNNQNNENNSNNNNENLLLFVNNTIGIDNLNLFYQLFININFIDYRIKLKTNNNNNNNNSTANNTTDEFVIPEPTIVTPTTATTVKYCESSHNAVADDNCDNKLIIVEPETPNETSDYLNYNEIVIEFDKQTKFEDDTYLEFTSTMDISIVYGRYDARSAGLPGIKNVDPLVIPSNSFYLNYFHEEQTTVSYIFLSSLCYVSSYLILLIV